MKSIRTAIIEHVSKQLTTRGHELRRCQVCRRELRRPRGLKLCKTCEGAREAFGK